MKGSFEIDASHALFQLLSAIIRLIRVSRVARFWFA